MSERITQTERVIQSSATDQKSHLTEVISSNQQAIKSAVFEVVVNSGTKNKDIITNVLTTQADSISKVNELITSVFNLVLKIDRDSLPVIVDGLKPQFENNREYLTIANSSLFQQLRLLQATIFSIASRETPKENIRREGGGISVFEYKNEQTGETVVNREKDHILTSSQLFIEKKLVFEIQYDKEGRICHSKNYSKDGRMTSELTFHPNGQIATRRQFILKDGKISTLITRFDNIGNKIS